MPDSGNCPIEPNTVEKNMNNKSAYGPLLREFLADLEKNLKKMENKYHLSSAEMLEKQRAGTLKLGGKYLQNEIHKWGVFYRAFLKLKAKHPEP